MTPDCRSSQENIELLEYIEGVSLDEYIAMHPTDSATLGLLIRQMSGRKYRRIIDRCCRQSPAERYQSIPALRRAFAIRRHLPVAVAAVLFAVFVLTMILPSKVETAVTESFHNALQERLRTEMSSFYIPARDSLPADQHLACEEIFAEQSAVLDSILLSLPGASGR